MTATERPRAVLLIGGTSEIGLAIVRRLCTGAPGGQAPVVHLLGRDTAGLKQAATELGQLAAGVEVDQLDAEQLDSHEQTLRVAFERAGGFDVVIVAVGLLGAQEATAASTDEANAVMSVNFVGAGSLLLHSLRRLELQGNGTLVVLSSVAAERPRASNAIYSAAKSGLDALAQGLADRVAGSGVRVLVVRPGFVRTKMTAGLKPAPFATTAEAVADATARALDGHAHTVWVPRELRYVFAVLRHLPRPVFRRLSL